eukprot:s2196_g3.t1
MAFTLLLGFACIWFWRWHQHGNQAHGLHEEPDAAPAAADAMQVNETVQSSASGNDQVQVQQQVQQHEPFTAEHYVDWCIQRCARRRDSTADHERRRRYEERVTILCGLSDDEKSPHYRSISDAQRAYDII